MLNKQVSTEHYPITLIHIVLMFAVASSHIVCMHVYVLYHRILRLRPLCMLALGKIGEGAYMCMQDH